MAINKGLYEMLLLSVILIALTYPDPEEEMQQIHTTELPSIPADSWESSLPRTGGINGTGTRQRLSKMETHQRLDFYKGKCGDIDPERVVNSMMARIFSHNKNAPAQLLRLMFHDCFIQGCDGSILLDANTGNRTHPAERSAKPSETLKGFDVIDQIKEELEKKCPGIVSCSDILVLATRDAINLDIRTQAIIGRGTKRGGSTMWMTLLQTGGPYLIVSKGRRDSTESYFGLATAEIPRPEGNISEALRLFKLRGFSPRETVALLGAHNIGKIDCRFIQPRFSNFDGTGQPDPTLSSNFSAELRASCPNGSSSMVRSGSSFGPKYYQRLVQGRGLLFADQQLMANNETAEVVRAYAADTTGRAFRADFALAMSKMARLHVRTGSQGQVRRICSRISSSNSNSSNSTRKSNAAMTLKINMGKSIVFVLALALSRMIPSS